MAQEPTKEKITPSLDPYTESLQGLLQIEGMENIPQEEKMFPFSGAWVPTIDGTLIGPENFQSLINMRYNDAGIEGISGYTFRNSTAITTYVNIKNGHYLKTQGRTQENYVLVHAVSSGNVGRIYINKTAIGTTGDFATGVGEQDSGSRSDHFHTDASNSLVGRFSKAPGENVAYANGEEVLIWSGDESTVNSVFTTSNSAEANPIDVTDKLTNSRNDASNIVDLGTSRDYLTILTVRPIQGFKFYVETANTTASALEVSYWDGSAYQNVTNLVDNTDTGPSLAQTGTVTFDSTRGIVKLKHFEERYLYAYQIYLNAGDAELYQITYDAPAQVPTNVWDGVYRTPIQAQIYTASSTSYEDFTLHVAESSSVNLPVGAIMDGFVATNDKFYIMFDEPIAGLKVTMLGQLINLNTSTATLKYWDGDSFESLTIADGTSSNSITLGQSGVISWNPASDEEKTTLFGTQGYAYEFTVSVTLSDTTAGKTTEDIVIDLLTGIPAPKTLPTFLFPVQYKSKLFLCNNKEGNEGNRIDYSIDNAPDIFNGESSSMDGYQSIYVGGSEHLTCAAQLYNRFGSNLFSSLAIFKNSELYLLTGDSPIDYQLFPVSYTIGCPAPQSLVTAEVGFELGENVARNVAIFISNAGPMMYDGAVLYPIRGIEKFFDPTDDDSVNFTYLNDSKGWFDSTYKEYNMLIPTGVSTTLNTWLCYDLVRKKWYQKNVGVAANILCGFNVTATNGDQYIYAGTYIGKIAQLEHGTSWGGTAIGYEVKTADIFPSGSEWDITTVRRLKFICQKNEFDTTITYYYYLDTDSGAAGSSSITTSGSGNDRLVRATKILNNTGWSHSFKFAYLSDGEEKGMKPVMWGIQYSVTRKDY